MNSLRVYEVLIARAAVRVRDTHVYYESHHVVPRSLGGSDESANRVLLTAREHFIAHRLLYRLYPGRATATAFALMVNTQNRGHSKAYETARQQMSEGMRGEMNVAKRPEVRKKLVENNVCTHRGKRRYEHSELMHEKGLWAGEKNPGYGRSDEQRGALNACAVAVIGTHPQLGVRHFATLTEAGAFLGVTYQAIYQANKKKQRSKGWFFERAA